MSCIILWTNPKLWTKQGQGTGRFTREYAERHVSCYEGDKDGTRYYVIDLEVYRAIAEICVFKGLPGGDPCWIAKKIAGYLNPVHK